MSTIVLKFSFLIKCISLQNNSGVLNESIATSLDIIKARSGQFFAFNVLSMNGCILSIQPSAEYLFSNLTSISIESYNYSVVGPHHCDKVYPTINEFEKLIAPAVKHDFLKIDLSNFVTPDSSKPEFISTLQTRARALKASWGELVNIVPNLLEDKTSDLNQSSWPSIKELTITNYDKDDVDQRLFEIFPFVEKFKIEALKSVKTSLDVFPKAEHLTDLEISCWCGCYLAESAFCNLSKLKRLSTRILSVDILSKMCLLELEELDLSKSRLLTKIEQNTFLNLPKLKTLNLSRCSIEFIHQQAFDHLVSLEELNLNFNKLRILELGRVIPRVLNVEFNAEFIVLAGKSNDMKTLKISPSREFLFSGTFSGLKKLFLKISSLDDICAGQFKSLRDLNELELSLDLVIVGSYYFFSNIN
jgi:Leucine-rich repeat (LRR) protein